MKPARSLLIIFLTGMALMFMNTAPKCYADQSLNYFKPLNPSQINPMLLEMGFSSCEEFLNKNPSNSEIFSLGIQALSFDFGLCREQDLEKAVSLYERAMEGPKAFPYLSLRPALIYSYGPQKLQNPDRAAFLYRQAVLDFALIEDMNLREQIFQKYLGGESTPPELNEEIHWLTATLKKPATEREKIAGQLEQNGFSNTSVIWPLTQDFENMVIEIE